jgi:hypothetical protein
MPTESMETFLLESLIGARVISKLILYENKVRYRIHRSPVFLLIYFLQILLQKFCMHFTPLRATCQYHVMLL